MNAERTSARRSRPVLHRRARVFPRPPSARHRRDVGVAHFLEIVSRERRAESATAIEDELGVLVGHARLDVALDYPLPQVVRASHVSGGPLTLLPYIDYSDLSALQLSSRFVHIHFAHPRFRVVNKLEECGGMLHTLAGARLPVSCCNPRWAPRRATSSTAATAAADMAAQASAAGHLS